MIWCTPNVDAGVEQYQEVISDHISKHFPLPQVAALRKGTRIAQFPAAKTYSK